MVPISDADTETTATSTLEPVDVTANIADTIVTDDSTLIPMKTACPYEEVVSDSTIALGTSNSRAPVATAPTFSDNPSSEIISNVALATTNSVETVASLPYR